MVAFCETERLKACFLSVKAHSGTQTKRPATSSGLPLTFPVFQTWLVVLCMLFAICWILCTVISSETFFPHQCDKTVNKWLAKLPSVLRQTHLTDSDITF